MIFSSAKFLVFFGCVFAAYWLPGLLPFGQRLVPRYRVVLLLLASYFFYASWNPYLLSLIIFSTLVDFSAGAAIAKAEDPRRRRFFLVISLVTNLGLLGVFKYANFFISSAEDLLSMLGVAQDPILLNIILPVGISFYTFQSMSYTIDIFRGKIEPEPNILDFAMFVAFFPQLVAGPIVRASDFLWQIRVEKRLKAIEFDASIQLILRGLAKKVLIADNLAPFVDTIFANPEGFGTINAWLGVTAYSFQIYCDFSGYSDVAIGIAGLLGYRIPKNFDLPYMAQGFSDFWRRWHISLSGWLRDYLYIPLGGNRFGQWATYRNLMLTMLLGGLWHGAAYTFIVWGFVHGAYLALQRLAQPGLSSLGRRLPKPMTLGVSIFFTYLLVNLTWVFFRAESLADALTMLGIMFSWVPDAEIAMPPFVGYLVAFIAAAHVIGEAMKNAPDGFVRLWRSVSLPVELCLLSLLLMIGPESHEQPFIYFQF